MTSSSTPQLKRAAQIGSYCEEAGEACQKALGSFVQIAESPMIMWEGFVTCILLWDDLVRITQ